MSKSAAQKILEAISFLKSEDPKLVNSIMTDQGLEKAAQDLTPGEHVKDRWGAGEMHRNPTREELKFGPSQLASGEGAENMVRDYSHPAKQEGIQLMAEKLGEMFGPLHAGMKSMIEGQTAMLAALKAMSETTAKAKKAEEGEEDEEEEVVEINEEKAKSLFFRAGELIRKAKKAEAKSEEAKDEGDEEKCKSLAVKARQLKREAGVLLGKARTAAYAAGSETIKSDIRILAKKSDVNVVEDEEEEEDDEDEKAEKAKAAATAKADADAKAAAEKAKTDITGNQADKKDPATGNQDASAAKAVNEAATAKALSDALSGIKTLETTVRGLVDVVAGKSKVSDLVPDLAKASTEVISSISEKIAHAEDSGALSEFEGASARNILAKSAAAKAGLVNASVVADLLSKAPINVRTIFAEAAPAALVAA